MCELLRRIFAELCATGDEAFKRKVEDIEVYARGSPAHKPRLSLRPPLGA